MTIRLLLALLLGVALLVAVLLRFDLGAVLASLTRAGLGGFVLIVAAGLAAEVVLSLGLWPLLPRPVPFMVLVAARQLRDSASDTLPITQIGGLAFAVRMLVLAGMGAAEASAAVVADLTAETFAQGLYVLAGVLASLSLLRENTLLSPYAEAMLGGAVLMSLGSMGFALVQIAGGGWVDRIAARLFVAAQGAGFHDTVRAIYRRRGRLTLSIALQLAGWIASGLWLWVILRAMGLHADIRTAIAIQALVEGLRSALVFIPASVGVQEAGYAVLAPVFGFTPETGLALSLVRRARDVVVALPVLLLWQAVEAHRAARR
jgi:putative membrane protein